jgi:predicted ATPase
MGRIKRPFSTRIGETKKSKRQIQKERLQREIEELEDFKENLYKNSDKGKSITSIDIYQNGVAEFFLPVSFESNKIHILRGNNGQGKSTLLQNIVKSTSYNKINNHAGKIKFGSNDYEIAKFITKNDEATPFRFDLEEMKNNEFFNIKDYDNTNSNIKNNITLYTDFTIDFFRNKVNLFSEIIQNVDKHSNGERKISGINAIFHYLKILQYLDIDKIQESINFIICMDEPESGLSVELQEEFYKRVKYYLNKITKSEKITLTFFIVSHSFIWKKEKDILIHNINSFKKEITKKEHTKVFI